MPHPLTGYDPIPSQSSGNDISLAPICERNNFDDGDGSRKDSLDQETHHTPPKAADNSTEQIHLVGGFRNHLPANPWWRNSSRKSLIRGSGRQIALACTLLLLPLALSGVLVYLIYSNLQPRNDATDTVTEDGRERPLGDQEYYVNYSATQLVFISSLSSTLALALVPVGMVLFSFITARNLQQASAAEDLGKLPTPYQFELCLRLINGGALDLWRYLLYLMRAKGRRIAAVAMLHRAACMLACMFVLAIGVTIVDALFHIKTSTIQYNLMKPYQNANFRPGRELPIGCWNVTGTPTYACNIDPGGSGANPRFENATEAYLAMGNSSSRNFIRLADDGQTSVIVPTQSPAQVSFTAQSFASSTVCETITKRCNPFYDYGGCDACQSYNFSCTTANAGAEFSAEFATLFEHFDFSISFFNTSAKVQNISAPTHADNGQIWTGMVIQLENAEPHTTQNLQINGSDPISYDPNLDLIVSTRGLTWGILSCNTTLSDVTYNLTMDGSVKGPKSKPMNNTASQPFVQAWTYGFGNVNINGGLNLVGASAKDSRDLAYQFARVLDRTILGLSSGILSEKDAVSMLQQDSRQVAKLPIPEFVALIVLNLALPAVGIVLGTLALIFSHKQGVTDVQARLGMGALVAGMFEDEKLNGTATSVEDLYAELRGLPTGKIVARDPKQGVRMYGSLSG